MTTEQNSLDDGEEEEKSMDFLPMQDSVKSSESSSSSDGLMGDTEEFVPGALLSKAQREHAKIARQEAVV